MDADPIPLSSLCVIPTGDEERERTRKKRAGRQTGKQEEHSFIVRVRTPEREEGRNEEEIASHGRPHVWLPSFESHNKM